MLFESLATFLVKPVIRAVSTRLTEKFFPFDDTGLIIRDLRGTFFYLPQNILDIRFYFTIQNFSGYNIEIENIRLYGRKNSSEMFVLSTSEHYVIEEKKAKDYTVYEQAYPKKSEIIVETLKMSHNPNEIGLTLEINFNYDKVHKMKFFQNDMFQMQLTGFPPLRVP